MNGLKHYVFEFSGSEKTESLNLHKEDSVFLVINGVDTKLRINDLFMKEMVLDEDDITGYSILQLLVENKLVIDGDTTLDITFIGGTSGKRFYISKIRRPFIYEKDLPITVVQRLQVIDILLSAIKPAQLGELIPSEAVLSSDSLNTASLVLGGDTWEAYRNDLIAKGFNETINGNYRYFSKDNQIAFFLLIPGSFVDIDLYVDENGNYCYTHEGNEYELNFKNDKLTIKQIIL